LSIDIGFDYLIFLTRCWWVFFKSVQERSHVYGRS